MLLFSALLIKKPTLTPGIYRYADPNVLWRHPSVAASVPGTPNLGKDFSSVRDMGCAGLQASCMFSLALRSCVQTPAQVRT